VDTVTKLRAPRWRSSPARRDSDKLLDAQGIRSELTSRWGNVEYLDQRRQARMQRLLAGWRMLAPLEHAVQMDLERDVALAEGRVPPMPPAASARPRKLRAA
jgi:hypothetical protein